MIHLPALALAAPLMLLGMARRVHRNIARQKVIPWRLRLRIAILCTLFAVLLGWPVFDPWLASAQIAGAAAGALLALQGLRLTRFEWLPDGGYFRPNPVLGIAVSMVFLGRMIYRLIELYPSLAASPAGQAGASSLFNAGSRTALTMALFGLVMGYFSSYCLGVLKRSRASRSAD